MTFDPAWDMPKTNWQQQGSFEQGELALVDHPSDAPLVCIPPINRHWLPYILGCLDQLTNPSSWIVADDTALNAILDKAIELKQLVGQAGDCVLCPLIRLQECVLQYSCDGGATWTDVAGWSANLSTCVQGALPPQVPPNPGGTPHDQHACNLAGYLATKLIQETMVVVHTVVSASGNELTFATDVMSLIGFAFPITYSAVLAFHDFWAAVSGQTLADINTAATDPTLWSAVTCAIYTAIRVVGYVDHSNFAAVATNLAAVSYMFGWVAPALHNYWNELGLGNIQSQQAIGALDDVDCSGCASPPTWCFEWDFRSSDGGWANYGSPTLGVYVPGTGWQSTVDITIGYPATVIYKDLGAVYTQTEVDAWIITDNTQGTGTREFAYQTTFGTTTATNLLGSGSSPFPGSAATIVATHTYRYLVYVFSSQGGPGTTETLQSVQIHGLGSNPFGTDNCTY